MTDDYCALARPCNLAAALTFTALQILGGRPTAPAAAAAADQLSLALALLAPGAGDLIPMRAPPLTAATAGIARPGYRAAALVFTALQVLGEYPEGAPDYDATAVEHLRLALAVLAPGFGNLQILGVPRPVKAPPLPFAAEEAPAPAGPAWVKELLAEESEAALDHEMAALALSEWIGGGPLMAWLNLRQEVILTGPCPFGSPRGVPGPPTPDQWWYLEQQRSRAWNRRCDPSGCVVCAPYQSAAPSRSQRGHHAYAMGLGALRVLRDPQCDHGDHKRRLLLAAAAPEAARQCACPRRDARDCIVERSRPRGEYPAQIVDTDEVCECFCHGECEGDDCQDIDCADPACPWKADVEG